MATPLLRGPMQLSLRGKIETGIADSESREEGKRGGRTGCVSLQDPDPGHLTDRGGSVGAGTGTDADWAKDVMDPQAKSNQTGTLPAGEGWGYDC
jgi:hypothetical protein